MLHECVILADSPSALVELCGISVLERLLRTLQRCGFKRATVLSSTPKLITEQLGQTSWPREQLNVTIRDRDSGSAIAEQIVDVWPEVSQLALVVRGDTVFDIRLLHLLATRNSPAALVDSAVPLEFKPLVSSAPDTGRGKFCGAAVLRYDSLSSQSGSFDNAVRNGLEESAVGALDVADEPLYHPALRRKLRPSWFLAPAGKDKKLAERILLQSTQKGALDFPALIHGPLETFLISHLCKTAIKPNQLTAGWIIGAFIATILFATGHLIWGTACALIVGIIDGLDGRQARLKVETTKGGKLEHRFDSFFEVVWPTALAYHFYMSGELPDAFRYLFLLILAEALDGIAKGGIYFASEKLMKEPSAFDRMVRLVGGRRNVYIWILAVEIILGAPAKALIVMAWWELITAVLDLPHAAWALYRLQNQSTRLR